MTPAEAERLADLLEGVLRPAGLDWVLEEVEGEVALGALVPANDGAAYEEDDSLPFELVAAPTTTSRVDIKAEPLSSHERLLVLVNAARQALVVPATIAASLPALLGDPGLLSIVFVDTAGTTESRTALVDMPPSDSIMALEAHLAALETAVHQ